MLGEKRIFNLLADENRAAFDSLGVQKIITLSPHSYNAFKKFYPNTYEVYHYTQILRLLIGERKLNFSNKFNAKLTFHDPCFLGRHNDEYEAPREVLNSVPGIEFVEMGRNRQNAFCCGGGSGNFYIDSFGGGENSPARSRVREALETGADVLAVACPTCTVMLNDAVKSENLEGKLAIKDICEVVNEAL
jgi:Fe-S oxidoreductase